MFVSNPPQWLNVLAAFLLADYLMQFGVSTACMRITCAITLVVGVVSHTMACAGEDATNLSPYIVGID